jgi:hypothetical protein
VTVTVLVSRITAADFISVTINQASPLLRLPAEIRNQIWRLVVGGKVIREQVTKRGRAQMLPRPCERTNTFALLRVCRQIYAETALLPFSANTFLFRRYWDMGGRTNDLRKHQYSQIRDVQLEVTTLDTTKSVFQDRLTVRFKKMQLDRRFPGLQRLHVCVFPFRKKPKWSVSKCEAFIRTNLAPDVLAMGYGVTIEKMRTGWPRFNRL